MLDRIESDAQHEDDEQSDLEENKFDRHREKDTSFDKEDGESCSPVSVKSQVQVEGYSP